MNNTKKLGLTALAGSLIAASAYAGDLSVTGSAGITYSNNTSSPKGNAWSMGDSVTFAGGGDLDNGHTINVSYEYDGDASGTDSTFDSQSITYGMGDMGTIIFAGHGGSSAVGRWDDMTPTAYEEVWTGDAGVGRAGGSMGENAWIYKGTFSDLDIHLSYQNAETGEYDSDTSYGAAYNGVDGLSIGAAMSDVESSPSKTVEHRTVFATYAVGSMTFGIQNSTVDDSANSTGTDDTDMMAYSASFAVNDNLSLSVGQNEVGFDASTLNDQEATGFSVSYTMGSISVKAMRNEIDNVNGVGTDDRTATEVAVSFAF